MRNPSQHSGKRLNSNKAPGREIRRVLAATLAMAALGLAAAPASAATVMVTTTTDQVVMGCPANCSLRDAVAQSNPGDTIMIPAGHYLLTLGEITIDKDLTLAGDGARSTVLDGNGASRIFLLTSGSPQRVELDDLSLINGLATTPIPGVGAIAGGALGGSFGPGGSLTLLRCQLTGSQAAAGGAIGWFGNLTVDQCTFAGNLATSNFTGGGGGGVLAGAGDLTIANSTFSGNRASTAVGGGAAFGFGGTVNLVNNTITANQAVAGGGLALGAISGSMANSIVAANVGGGCVGATLSSDHNLDSDNTCHLTSPGDLPGVAPLLGPLADNGGPTDTHALLGGSPAYDAGNNATCLAIDQREVPRPQRVVCDIGAAEMENVAPALTSDHASVTVNEAQTAANTGTVSDGNGDAATLTASVGTVVNNGDGTWVWSFLTSDGPTQSQTVTISGDDGHGGTGTTSFSLVVVNVAPTIVSVSNNGPVVAGSPATITVTATDPAGANDPLTYSFDCDNNGTFEIGPQAGNSAACTFATGGSKTVNVRVADDDGGTATGSTVVTVLIPPPSCGSATASPNLLWPPNHKFVAITISGIVNPAPGAVTISVTSIFQDEPVQSPGSGNTSPDATGVGTSSPSVRSERDGNGDGRVYHINFTATGASGSCTGSVTVGVPHDQGHNGGPVDQGSLYNSTTP